jgi:hypothetical protein
MLKNRCMKIANASTTKAEWSVCLWCKSGKTSAGYLLDPIAHEPNPRTAFAVNGISAIQYYENNHLLIVERSTLLKTSLHY